MLYTRATAGLIAPVVVDGVVPWWIVAADHARFDPGWARIVGLPFIALGLWLLLDSVFLRFAREGRGTLVPIDPPRFVVRGGAYRYVRNPMYVANVAIVAGTAVVCGSWHLLVWAATIFVVFSAFVLAYEEPALRRAFGADYDRYRDEVGRWLPRLRNGQRRAATPRSNRRNRARG